MNQCLSLGLTKTDYEMSLRKFEMKLPGCEILGTAARTLAPLTNFPRAAAFPRCEGVGAFAGQSDGGAWPPFTGWFIGGPQRAQQKIKHVVNVIM